MATIQLNEIDSRKQAIGALKHCLTLAEDRRTESYIHMAIRRQERLLADAADLIARDARRGADT